MMQRHSEYRFGDTVILLESDSEDLTACVDSLTVKVDGEPTAITQKFWCGHHFCSVVTQRGTLDLPSCARSSPPRPTWTPATG